MQRFVQKILGLGFQNGDQMDEELDGMSRSSSSLEHVEDEEGRVVSSWEETREDVWNLLEAVENGDGHSVLTAIRQGVNIDSTGDGFSALHLACKQGNAEIARLLIFHGCDLNLPTAEGDCAIHIAVKHRSLSCLRCLLLPQPNLIDVDQEDLDERTALHTAADIGDEHLTACLLSHQPRLDKQDIDGCTPLILAASHGHQSVVNMLTAAKCDLDQRNNEGRTALMECAIGNHIDVVRCLLQGGCHVNVMDSHGYTALSDAVCGGRLDMVNLLIEGNADVNIQDSRGRTSLHIAILYGYNTIASTLIHAGALINIQDHDGFTPTFMAAWDPWNRGTLPTLHQLAQVGANLNLADHDNTPPIVKAWSRQEVVAVLIQNGCNVNIVTKYGLTLLELCALQDKFDMAAALLCAGAKPPKYKLFGETQTKYEQEFQVLQSLCSAPVSLKDQCRLKIRQVVSRKSAGGIIIQPFVEQLPLPALIKHFLMFEELFSYFCSDKIISSYKLSDN